MAYSLAHNTAQHSAASFQSAQEAVRHSSSSAGLTVTAVPVQCRKPVTTVHTAPDRTFTHPCPLALFPWPNNQLDSLLQPAWLHPLGAPQRPHLYSFLRDTGFPMRHSVVSRGSVDSESRSYSGGQHGGRGRAVKVVVRVK